MAAKLTAYLNFKNAQLVISSIIVIHTAFIYGAFTHTKLPRSLDINVDTVDLANFFRAIMCLYLAIAAVWVLGIINQRYWRIATLLNILFMGSLALGRTISILVDGLPSEGYIFGVIAEFALAIYGVFQLRKFGSEKMMV